MVRIRAWLVKCQKSEAYLFNQGNCNAYTLLWFWSSHRIYLVEISQKCHFCFFSFFMTCYGTLQDSAKKRKVYVWETIRMTYLSSAAARNGLEPSRKLPSTTTLPTRAYIYEEKNIISIQGVTIKRKPTGYQQVLKNCGTPDESEVAQFPIFPLKWNWNLALNFCIVAQVYKWPKCCRFVVVLLIPTIAVTEILSNYSLSWS